MKLTKPCGRDDDDSSVLDEPAITLCASMLIGLGATMDEAKKIIMRELRGQFPILPTLEAVELAKSNDPIVLFLREREQSIGAAIVLVENLSKKKALDSLYKDLERTEASLKAHGETPRDGL